MSSLEDEEINIPADTLAILNEFLNEKAEREREEQARILDKSATGSMLEEDWQLSQFWYNEETISALGKVVEQLVEQDQKVALLSCPSIYTTVKNIHKNVKIFEFDKRFSIFGNDFIFYDINRAFQEPEYFDDHSASYDLIIADPPFLSEDCINKTAQIINKLKKPNGKLIFCSGEVVELWIGKYLELKRCSFRPEHKRNLGNQFVSYANFNLDELL